MKNKLNILLAVDTNKSRPWFRDRIPAVIDAIEKVEWSCEIIDIYNILGKYKYMPTNVIDRNIFFQTCNMLEINKTFENEIIVKNPDILILGTADNYIKFLIPKTIRNIQESGIKVIGILGDDEFNYPQYRFLLGWFDLFVAYVKPCLEYYENFNLSKGYYFPNSCYLHNKKFNEHSQKTKYDVVLVGAPIANRPEMVEGLINSGINLAIYGSPKWKKYSFTNGYYFGFVDTNEFDIVLSNSKIVLAFLEDHITGALHMNTKIWEAVRVGRLPIVTYYDRLVEDYKLVDGVDIVMYKSQQELIDKVNYYVNNNEERLKIAKALYEKVESSFEYSTMYKKLFNNLMNNDLNKKTTLKSNLLKELEKEYFTYYPSDNSELDYEVLNYIKIAEKISLEEGKIDFIYFNTIENGRLIRQTKPFINFDSIIFLNGKQSRLYCYFIFILSIFSKRVIHVNQFSVVSKHHTMFGNINRFLYRMSQTKAGLQLRKIMRI